MTRTHAPNKRPVSNSRIRTAVHTQTPPLALPSGADTDEPDDFMESDTSLRPDDSELDTFFEDLTTIDDLEVVDLEVAFEKPLALADVEKWLLERPHEPEKPYGMFTKDVTVLKFFQDKHSENVLADIRQKNAEQKMGNVKIPGTEIELINYSCCPQCKAIYSLQDLVNYYRHPLQLKKLDRKTQYREDTRVYCRECHTFFLPALVICDGTPKQEVQFLCRMQTLEAVESFYAAHKQIQVLSRKTLNLVENSTGLKGLVNDVKIADLQTKPTLIANLLQYTPVPLILSFIEGHNLKQKDVLYGAWFQPGQWRH